MSALAWRGWAAFPLALCAGPAQAAGLDARMGLSWGQSVEQVRALAKGWLPHQRGEGVESYYVKALPGSHPAFPVIRVTFRAGRLAEVLASTAAYASDRDGSLGRTAYAGVAMALTHHYGQPDPVFERVQPPERQPAGGFYACLQLERCGMWMRYWDHAESFVHLQIGTGLGPDAGFLLLRAVDPAVAGPKRAPGMAAP